MPQRLTASQENNDSERIKKDGTDMGVCLVKSIEIEPGVRQGLREGRILRDDIDKRQPAYGWQSLGR